VVFFNGFSGSQIRTEPRSSFDLKTLFYYYRNLSSDLFNRSLSSSLSGLLRAKKLLHAKKFQNRS